MTRLWPTGLSIEVESDSTTRPVSFMWERQSHAITYIANEWLIDQFWWQSQVCRQYYKVTTKTGLMVILFQDRLSGQWFLEKLFD